ncbi:MAG: hypothetical protein AB7P03_28500 [Kofleriaceae bacterium]
MIDDCWASATSPTAAVGKIVCSTGPVGGAYDNEVEGRLAGYIYADGTYHLVSFIDDDSTIQVAISGRLSEPE